MSDYFISEGYDRKLHIHKWGDTKGENYDFSWEGLTLKVKHRAFSNMLIKPREVGDEFEMIGRTFVIIGYDEFCDPICAVANAIGYRLLLHKLIWDTEIRLENKLWWSSIPIGIRDHIDTPDLWRDIKEIDQLFREKRKAKNEPTSMV